MPERQKKPMIPEWAMIAMVLGGGGAGASALGLQSTAEPRITRAELNQMVDQDDLDKLEATVDKLADAVMELTIEVRTRRGPQ